MVENRTSWLCEKSETPAHFGQVREEGRTEQVFEAIATYRDYQISAPESRNTWPRSWDRSCTIAACLSNAKIIRLGYPDVSCRSPAGGDKKKGAKRGSVVGNAKWCWSSNVKGGRLHPRRFGREEVQNT